MARVPASTQIEVIAALREIRDEVSRVLRKQPRAFSSPHEGYAFIRDRLDELWAQVRGDDRSRAREQAIQVAAMAVRFMIDIKDSGCGIGDRAAIVDQEIVGAALQTLTRVECYTDGLMPTLMPSASSFHELTQWTRHASKAVPNTCVPLKCQKICAPVSEICTERGLPIPQTSTLRCTLACAAD